MNPWFKFYAAEYLSDPKIDQLNPAERSCWLTLLCLANVANDGGVVHNLKVFTLLTKSGVYPLDSGAVQMDLPDLYTENLGVMEHFEALGMVERVEVYSYKVTNWEKRQETNLTEAERAKSYRDRKRHANVTRPVTNVTQEQNRIEKNISVANAPRFEEVQEITEENTRTKTKPKYPNARVVFSWFPNPQKSWEINTIELKHAELLFMRGEEVVKKALAFVRAHQDDENFNYKVIKPSDLERKWEDLKDYAKRNS